MKSLILKAPVNPLSFGNVSYNLIRELFRKDINVSLFPIGQGLDFSVFDKADPELKKWAEDCATNRFLSLKKETPTLQMWHLNGSESRISRSQFLYTFYELDSPTLTEKNLVDIQDEVIFSSSNAASKFKIVGCENVSSCPLGFDEDFHETGKEYMKDKIHFTLIGKFEKRKHTQRILEWWVEKYGNNYDYQLSCCIINPFYQADQMNQAIAQSLKGVKYGNVNFLPFLKTNSEVNELMNSSDIDLSGLSGAEGWNLPSFNSTCLGKWSIVLNSSSHKDWATKENCILVEPDGTEEVYDNIFFNRGAPFNQGNISNFSKEKFHNSIEKAISKCKSKNEAGAKLREVFTYSNTVDKILSTIEKKSDK